MSTVKRRLTYWSTPILALLIGVVYLVAYSLGGRPGDGAIGFAVMAIAAALLLLAGRRSETVQGLLSRTDERIAGIDLRATAVAGVVLIVVLLVSFVVSIATGHSGSPYDFLGAVAGGSYVLALLWYRVRT